MHFCRKNKEYYKDFELYSLFLNTGIILNTSVSRHHIGFGGKLLQDVSVNTILGVADLPFYEYKKKKLLLFLRLWV